MELLGIDRFNLGLLTFSKICEFLKSAKVKVGLDVFSFFLAWRYVNDMLYFNEILKKSLEYYLKFKKLCFDFKLYLKKCSHRPNFFIICAKFLFEN